MTILLTSLEDVEPLSETHQFWCTSWKVEDALISMYILEAATVLPDNHSDCPQACQDFASGKQGRQIKLSYLTWILAGHQCLTLSGFAQSNELFPEIPKPVPPVETISNHPKCYLSSLQSLSAINQCRERLNDYIIRARQIDSRRLSYEASLSILDGKVRTTKGIFLFAERRKYYEQNWKPLILRLQSEYGKLGKYAYHIRVAEQMHQRGLDHLFSLEARLKWGASLPR